MQCYVHFSVPLFAKNLDTKAIENTFTFVLRQPNTVKGQEKIVKNKRRNLISGKIYLHYLYRMLQIDLTNFQPTIGVFLIKNISYTKYTRSHRMLLDTCHV